MKQYNYQQIIPHEFTNTDKSTDFLDIVVKLSNYAVSASVGRLAMSEFLKSYGILRHYSDPALLECMNGP